MKKNVRKIWWIKKKDVTLHRFSEKEERHRMIC